jgi:hypothetical protein
LPVEVRVGTSWYWPGPSCLIISIIYIFVSLEWIFIFRSHAKWNIAVIIQNSIVLSRSRIHFIHYGIKCTFFLISKTKSSFFFIVNSKITIFFIWARRWYALLIDKRYFISETKGCRPRRKWITSSIIIGSFTSEINKNSTEINKFFKIFVTLEKNTNSLKWKYW